MLLRKLEERTLFSSSVERRDTRPPDGIDEFHSSDRRSSSLAHTSVGEGIDRDYDGDHSSPAPVDACTVWGNNHLREANGYY